MTRTTKPGEKSIKKQGNKPGPPCTMTDEMVFDAQELVGKFGAINNNLATYFGKGNSTIDYWIRHYPKFERAVKKGRIIYGLQVARALNQRAVGYEYKSEKIIQGRTVHYKEDGKIDYSETTIIRVPIVKHVIPDTIAAIKILTILHRDIWTENTDVRHLHSGSIDHQHTHRKIEDIPITELNEKQRELIFSLNFKQLMINGNRN